MCSLTARRSNKAIGASVALLTASLIPPVIGNLVVVASGSRLVSVIGCYIYFLGMDLVMYPLLRFTFDYCHITRFSKKLKTLVYLLLVLDAAQLLCNPLLGHAFGIESTQVDGFDYYRLIPYRGQAFHRALDYSIFVSVLVIFFIKMIRSPRIYSERYSIIFFAMIVGGLWQTFYIFSRTPVDTSMIGFAVFGLLVFFFALYYRPLRLLDRMLANIASELKEALFFFDANGRCIWANAPGIAFVGVKNEDFEQVSDRLRQIFGDYEQEGSSWTASRMLGTGDSARYYVLEKHTLTDEKGRADGSFLGIRDNTEEQKTLRREQYTATHDMKRFVKCFF